MLDNISTCCAKSWLFILLLFGGIFHQANAGNDPLEGSLGLLPPGIEDLRITEVMYHPLDVGALNGDSLEFIELKNVGSTPVDLGGVAFTDGISFEFDNGITLAAGGFIVLAANVTEFANHYGFQPFGDFDGRLNNAGEQITLLGNNGTTLISFIYSDRYPWPLSPDGAGFSLVPVSESAGLDLNNPDNWRGSRLGGSPGADEPVVSSIAPIIVNEALTHTDLPFKDAIELFNPTNSTVDIGGWYLSDEKEAPLKYKFPANTEISAQGYLVFDEDDFNANPGQAGNFALSSFGDAIYLFSADDQDNLTGYMRGFTFGGADNGVTFGREEFSTGEEDFLLQKSETLGRENSGARIGPVVISELHYNPVVGEEEFIELINVSTQTIALFDGQFPENTWQIEGIAYIFPQNIEIGPQSIILVVPVEPAAFRAARGVPANVDIYGPYSGKLSNAGEVIRLTAPDNPDTDGTVPYFDIDRVSYQDSAPWPASADGGGPSIVKINLDGLSSDPVSWLATQNGGTPGYADLGSVAIEDLPGTGKGVSVEPAYPNPFTNTTSLVFVPDQSGRFEVRLFDILGRDAGVVFDEVVPAGTKQEVIIEKGNLSPGTYFLVVKSSRLEQKVQPVVIR